MKDEFVDLILKLGNFFGFIWSSLKDASGVINDTGSSGDVDGVVEAVSSPLRAVDFILNDSPDVLFYYFFTNSFSLILFGLFLYFGLGKFLFASSNIIAKVSGVLCFLSFKYIGASIVFSGGVIAMSGYFYPTNVVEYLGFFITFTFCLPYVILYLPFSIVLGLKSFILDFTGDVLDSAFKDIAKLSGKLPIGVDASDYAAKSNMASLKDGF